jgi:alkylhydroperoxidase/carboxymuconolactone decarboxylase family protein YurZ
MTLDPDALLKKMEKQRGYIHPAHNFLARECPDFLETWNQFVSAALLHEDRDKEKAALPVRYRELIVACLLAMRGSRAEAVAAHLERAMRDGLTTQEALEAFQAATVPGGAPVLVAGVRALMLVTDTTR